MIMHVAKYTLAITELIDKRTTEKCSLHLLL